MVLEEPGLFTIYPFSSIDNQGLNTLVFGVCPMAIKTPVQAISCFSWVLLLTTLAPVTTLPSPNTSSNSVLCNISIFSIPLTLSAIILEALNSSLLTSIVTLVQILAK